ncbi:glutathione synthetase [Methyloprofundus sedimenti]|uniref:Glutathione synthetase n=2 Tax=Methyloprofundus sedimenti TaxID=1420851 RepID=A0A1V8MAT9_9GAMM|nr:glutathione synthetase [Methyloprofundus sedimenti]
MYPWERVDPETDSTIRMIHECVSRGHTVALATVHNLTMRESTAMAFCNVFIRESVVPSKITTFYKNTRFRKVKLPLGGFDAIIMRSNPPLNVTALNFLDSVRDDVFIMNDIDGLRIANNKLYTSSFDDPENKYIPKTYVSKTPDYLESVLRDSATDKMIMKPLDGYGGHGVIMVEKKAQASFRSLLDFYINTTKEGNYVILQEYVEGAELGDVRILMLNGQVLGAMKRIPAVGDVRSNVHAGGSVVKHVLTKTEKDLCDLIGPKLVRDGLYFVGIDVIGGKLIEVNVLSPGGIMRINKLNRVKLQTKVIDFVELVVKTKNSRQYVQARKTEFSTAIDNV